MKKFMSLLIVSLFVMSMATTAFAMETQPASTTNGWYTRFSEVQGKIATRQSEIEQKKQEVADFRAAAQAKSALVKAATEENVALRQAIAAKRKELARIYADMKANGTTLEPIVLEQIANYGQQVRVIIDELIASKGSIQNYLDANRDSLKSLDYAVLESMYADIAEIQSWRNDQLNEVSRILDELLELVQ